MRIAVFTDFTFLGSGPWELLMNMHNEGKAGLPAIGIKAAILRVGFPRKVFLVSLGNMSMLF